MKKEYIQIKATPEFKKRVREAADRDNKTMSEYATDALLFKMSQDSNRKEK